MITKYIKGDLLDHEGPIAHGCNNKGVMRSGVAKAVREKCPLFYYRYKEWESDYYLTLGDVIPVRCKEHGLLGFNLITQDGFGYDGKQYVSYDAIEICFKTLQHHFNPLKIVHNFILGIPKIGAGLGGGDWNKIEEIINRSCPDLEIWVYEL